MPIEGVQRYFKLFENVQNGGLYLKNKIKKQPQPLTFTTKPFPITFSVPKSLYLVFKEIFMTDVYDINELVKRLPAKPVVIDIGANVGYFDILLLSKMQQATIYAYEPLPANTTLLGNTIAENTLLKESVHLYQMAVTGKPIPSLDLFSEDTSDGQVVASVFSDFNKDNTKKISIPAITLTEVINQIDAPVIDLLKMDCEGSEYDILYNTPAELIRRVKQMTIEVHDIDKEQNNIHAFNSYLQGLGYDTKFAPINDFCYALEATKR